MNRFSPSSRARLTRHDLGRFAGSTLFDRVGRALCEAGCLPRKEFFEAWEVARRTRRWLRGGRVIDVAGGHGLLAHLMVLLDDSSPSAVVVDPVPPASAERIIDRAVAARAPLAILPCCHDEQTCDAGGLTGWMDAALAIDTVRALRLQARGYQVRTQVIPPQITPKNRLILGLLTT